MENKKEISFMEVYQAFFKHQTGSPKSDLFIQHLQKLIKEGYTITDMISIDSSVDLRQKKESNLD